MSRVRRDIGDRNVAAPRWSDNEILSVLRETATTDFLSIELPEDTTVELQDVEHDLEGATLEVRVGTTAVELVLRRILEGGAAQAGGASSITLAIGASTVDHAYEGYLVRITAGAGSGQSRTITGYAGASRVATVAAWTTPPDATSVYEVFEADTFPLSTGIDYDKVVDLIDAVRALGKGWSVQLAMRAEGEIIDCPWPPASVQERRDRTAYGRLSADLMLTGGELDVFGAPKRLSLYDLSTAETRLRFLKATDGSEPQSVTDGDVTITRESAVDLLKAGAAPMGRGAWRGSL